jgi:hypothetical protein
VRVPSATGPRAALPKEHVAVLAGLHHRELAHCPEVYDKIRGWLGSVEPGACSTEDPCAADRATAERGFDRAEGYRALLQDAVHHGATAVQRVQEELTARPYDWIEKVPPLEGPAKVVRAVHFAAIRQAYDATRLVNRLVGSALREGIGWFKRT